MGKTDKAGKQKYSGDRGLEYYRAYPRDFFEGVVGMTGDLRGFYRMIIDLIYMHDGFLLNDFNHIAGMTGYGKTRAKRMLEELVKMGKIEVCGENSQYFTQKRAKLELNTSQKYRKKQENNARERWKNNDLGYAKGMPPQDHKTTRHNGAYAPSVSEQFLLFENDRVEKEDLAPPIEPERFDEFWTKAYPHRPDKRTGKIVYRNRKGALAKYLKAFRSGVDEQTIISKAFAYARFCKASDKLPRDAVTWFNQEGYADDYGETPVDLNSPDEMAKRKAIAKKNADRMVVIGRDQAQIGSVILSDWQIAEIKRFGYWPD